jgi:hypothetical protein
MQEFINGIEAGRNPRASDMLEMIGICNREVQLGARFAIAIDRRALQEGVIGDRASRVQDELYKNGITRNCPILGLACVASGDVRRN